MRERLKRAVLKTAVRETVPGVRIPLPPPLSQLAENNLLVLLHASPRLRNYSGLDLEKKSRPPVEAKFFLDIPPQKQTQDCTATVIWRPSLTAFF
jgi:hypothetical protein